MLQNEGMHEGADQRLPGFQDCFRKRRAERGATRGRNRRMGQSSSSEIASSLG